jgi:hypothetical protein
VLLTLSLQRDFSSACGSKGGRSSVWCRTFWLTGSFEWDLRDRRAIAVQLRHPTGSPWPPLLYLLYLAELLNQNKELRFGYADDLALTETSKSLDINVELLQQDAREVLQWCRDNKVHFAWEKSELLHISTAKDEYAPSVAITEDICIQPIAEPASRDDKPVKQPTMRWFDVYMDRRLAFRGHISERCSRAEKVA